MMEWKEFRAARKKEREKQALENRMTMRNFLTNEGLTPHLTEFNHGCHWRLTIPGVDEIDFWPGTGRWRVRRHNRSPRFGVSELIKYIREKLEKRREGV